MEKDYPRLLIERVTDDVCIVKRVSLDSQRMKVLIARLNYDSKAPNADFEVCLDGKLSEIDSVYNFEGDFGIDYDNSILLRKVCISEWSDLSNFANVFVE